MTPTVSIVIPAYNAAAMLPACLKAIVASVPPPLEFIVVDDGSTDATRTVAESLGARTLSSGGRRGPAIARNIGAAAATGDILFFVDADVCLHADAVGRVAQHFERDADLAALMGAYDEEPGDPGFLSQYRNLMHSYYHQKSGAEAHTFWTGCGAIRRDVFEAHDGFNEEIGRPAMEDIEFGYRLKDAGRKLLLDSSIRGKHLKRWDFIGMVRTDFFDRALPWVELILRHRSMPNHLNLQLDQRASVGLTGLLAALGLVALLLHGSAFLWPLVAAVVAATAWFWRDPATAPGYNKTPAGVAVALLAAVGLLATGKLVAAILLLALVAALFLVPRDETLSGPGGAFLLPVQAALGVVLLLQMPRDPVSLGFVAALVAILAINTPFYVFLGQRRGWPFAIAAAPFHLLYFFYSGLAVAIGLGNALLRQLRVRTG